MTRISELEQQEIKALGSKKIPTFFPGDTLRVLVNIVEGDRKRVQAFEGVCIARKNASLNSSFTVRKISCGEGVERVFPLYSPLVSIEVVRQGSVRRAKLYYLRGLTGKKARIKERPFWLSQRNEALVSEESSQTEVFSQETPQDTGSTQEAASVAAPGESAPKAEVSSSSQADETTLPSDSVEAESAPVSSAPTSEE